MLLPVPVWRRTGEGIRGHAGYRFGCKRVYGGLRVEGDLRLRAVGTPAVGGVKHLRALTPRGVAPAGTNLRKLVSEVLKDTSTACFDGIIQRHELRFPGQKVALHHRVAGADVSGFSEYRRERRSQIRHRL